MPNRNLDGWAGCEPIACMSAEKRYVCCPIGGKRKEIHNYDLVETQLFSRLFYSPQCALPRSRRRRREDRDEGSGPQEVPGSRSPMYGPAARRFVVWAARRFDHSSTTASACPNSTSRPPISAKVGSGPYPCQRRGSASQYFDGRRCGRSWRVTIRACWRVLSHLQDHLDLPVGPRCHVIAHRTRTAKLAYEARQHLVRSPRCL